MKCNYFEVKKYIRCIIKLKQKKIAKVVLGNFMTKTGKTIHEIGTFLYDTLLI